jgi:DNA-binding NarL/FixJ family response regulator
MKILLVDDHLIVRSGLRNLLTSAPGTQVIEAADGRDALARLSRDRPDLVLLDLNLPGIGGLELLRQMLAENGALKVLVLSMHRELLYVTRALEIGARGYLSKNVSPTELLAAVRRVGEGGRYIENEIAQELALRATSPRDALEDMTERELEIVRLLATGMNLTEIAAALGVGYKTVANLCTQIKGKLGVTRTTDLIRLAMTLGLS